MCLKNSILGVPGVRGVGGCPRLWELHTAETQPLSCSNAASPMPAVPSGSHPLQGWNKGQGMWHSPSEGFMKPFVHASVELSTARQTDIFVRWLSS